MAAAAVEIQNANPTILSASQLPTRQRRSTPRSGPDLKFSDVIYAKPSYLSRPFCADDLPWPKAAAAGDAQEGMAVDGLGLGEEQEQDSAEPIDEQEIYDLIAPISDPEHPVSLGQLSVINLSDIHISPSPERGLPGPNDIVRVIVEITPTVSHCSHATLIGLGVRVRLEQALPPNYRVEVRCKVDTHSQDDQVNKQLGDKERVAAALENETLKGVLDKMMETCP